jgi:2-polyprenyl-6-methoxyphenol hydroxylase-like FAD-dependent oxidoreductase
MSPPKDLHTLIIGGGSCGLALAQGLRKHNIPYTLFERDSADAYHARPRDWGSLLHWGQEYLRRCLDEELWARRAEMWVDPFYDYDRQGNTASLMWDAKSGEELVRPAAVRGTVRVSRRKVRVLLSQGLRIEYGKRLVRVEERGDGVTAYFEDGTNARGSMLVGCDGGKSKVREFVVGEKEARGFDSDYTMINTWSTLPADVAKALRTKHPIISQAMHPDVQVGGLVATLDVPTRNSLPEEWKFQIYSGWKGEPRKADLNTNKKAMAHFKRIFEQIAEPFCSVGKALTEDHTLPVDDGWNFKPTGDFGWDNHGGKVTLAGDAAHSMLPHRGQGLNNAIMDAAMVVQAIRDVVDGKSLEEAVQEYEDEMRPRGTKEVETTLDTMVAQWQRDLKKSPLFTIGFNRPQGPASKTNL